MSSTLLLEDVHDGVDALIQHNVIFDERPTGRPSLQLTGRDLDVLHALAQLRYLTTTMIAALAWGSYNSRLRERLNTLFRAGLVRRFRPVVRGRGGIQWVYELDTTGHRTLLDRRPETTPPWARSELFSFSYAEHDLELNALACELAARAARHHHRSGPLLHTAPFTMHGPRAGAIDPDHEARPLDADPANELPAGHTLQSELSHPGLLEPDLTLTGHHAVTGRPIAVLIEYDRTRRATKLTGKLHRYDHLLADGWRRTHYATAPDEPTVLFITRTDTHLPNALAEADRQLTAWTGPPNANPGERTYPGRQELGLTTRQRLLTGQDTIQQVTPQPPVQPRAATRPVPSVQTRLPLVALFAARS